MKMECGMFSNEMTCSVVPMFFVTVSFRADRVSNHSEKLSVCHKITPTYQNGYHSILEML